MQCTPEVPTVMGKKFRTPPPMIFKGKPKENHRGWPTLFSHHSTWVASRNAFREFVDPWKKYSIIHFWVWGPRGASDHYKDFRNERFRRFAIGAMLLVSLWDVLSQKL